MARFVFTLSDAQLIRYEGSFDVLDSGILKISTHDDDEHHSCRRVGSQSLMRSRLTRHRPGNGE
jgi:hypothetical protein